MNKISLFKKRGRGENIDKGDCSETSVAVSLVSPFLGDV